MTKLKHITARPQPKPQIMLNNQTGIDLDFTVGEHKKMKGVTVITLKLKAKPEDVAGETQSSLEPAAETA